MPATAHEALDLTALSVGDILRVEAHIRALVGDQRAVAESVVRYLYDALRHGPGGPRALALARFYRLQRYDALDAEAQRFARHLLTEEPRPGMKCLSLVATAGDEPAWNSPATSRGHRAIPLPSARIVRSLPMVAQLLTQFGLALHAVVDPDPQVLLDLRKRAYNVFHVEDALGSPYVPAQREFVVPFGVRSALGFGGLLPDGDLFAVVLFPKVRVARTTADLFPVLALSVRRALLGHDDDDRPSTAT